jgi:hypothetical protein
VATCRRRAAEGDAGEAFSPPRRRKTSERSANIAAFREGLAETGYVEGRNVAIEYRWASADFARLPGLAAELVARNVDLIVTEGGDSAVYAGEAGDCDDPGRVPHERRFDQERVRRQFRPTGRQSDRQSGRKPRRTPTGPPRGFQRQHRILINWNGAHEFRASPEEAETPIARPPQGGHQTAKGAQGLTK